MSEFAPAVAVVLENEGGEYTNDPRDPGGATKFGISRRSYPNVDIEHLTREDAIALYQALWNLEGFAQITAQEIATKVFDASVLDGREWAVTALQRACRACGRPLKEDGDLGPFTSRAANGFSPEVLLPALRSEIAAHRRLVIAHVPSDQLFEHDWIRRAYQ